MNGMIKNLRGPGKCLIVGRQKIYCKYFSLAGRGGYKCDKKRGSGAVTCSWCEMYKKENVAGRRISNRRNER